jgi:hypothetical protein
MRIGDEGGVTIGLGGRKFNLEMSVSKEQIDSGLSDIEDYIKLVDQAICHHPKAVKMTMMEAVLYTMAAPFANEWLRQKRMRMSLTDKRGPRHLIIYGPGGNGKTTFGRFQNHLLSTSPIEPVDGKNYKKLNWDNLFDHITTGGSPFPVIVDDIKPTCFGRGNGSLEGRIKAYFENEWGAELEFPMMIFNTNHDNLEEWAKTRVRRLDFLVKFRGTEEEQLRVQKILERTNHVFPAFSKLYAEELSKGMEYSHDELHLARTVFVKLYRLAGREFPDFFPSKPPEKIYDMDAIYCVHRESYKLFTEKKIGNGLRLEFKSYKTLKNYASRLPPSVSSIVDENVLIIENPSEYKEFMDKGRGDSKRGIIGRIFPR